jgi:hypothetical protein
LHSEEEKRGRTNGAAGGEERNGERVRSFVGESHMSPVMRALAATTFAVSDKLVLASSCLRSGGAVQLLLALNQKKMMRPLRGAAGVGLWLLTRPEGGTTDSSSNRLPNPSPTAGDIGPIYTSQANSVLQL